MKPKKPSWPPNGWPKSFTPSPPRPPAEPAPQFEPGDVPNMTAPDSGEEYARKLREGLSIFDRVKSWTNLK